MKKFLLLAAMLSFTLNSFSQRGQNPIGNVSAPTGRNSSTGSPRGTNPVGDVSAPIGRKAMNTVSDSSDIVGYWLAKDTYEQQDISADDFNTDFLDSFDLDPEILAEINAATQEAIANASKQQSEAEVVTKILFHFNKNGSLVLTRTVSGEEVIVNGTWSWHQENYKLTLKIEGETIVYDMVDYSTYGMELSSSEGESFSLSKTLK